MIDENDEFFLEEEFHKKNKKETKKIRKQLSDKDRSKYKRTNTIQKKETLSDDKDLFQGRVLSVSGEGSIVDCNDKKYLCSLKGVLKKEITQNKNILAVGDIVYFSKEGKDQGSIASIQPRYSILARKDPVKNKKHILAANIDQTLIVTSVVSPFLKPALVDRYIIAASKGNIQPVIIINKIDLLQNLDSKEYSKEEILAERETYEEFLKSYKKLNIPIISSSTKTKEGLKEIENIMKNKTSVFSGHSGTGKTSLINAILKTDLKTNAVVKKTHKGSHTTTKASLLPLKDGGFCIDTPGIKSFDLWQLTKNDIKNNFPEFFKTAKKCKYSNCYHINEPGCAVIEAVEKKEISILRFESYRSLIKETEETNKKR